MAVVSRPMAWAAFLGVVAAIALWSTNDSSPPPPPVPHKRVALKAGEPNWDLPVPDPNLRFGHFPGPPRDVFAPLVKADAPIVLPRASLAAGDALMAVPAKMAGGEAGWAYTGMVEADGVRMALLENKATKQAGYVREGDFWKAAHVVGISSPCVVFTDEKGESQAVYRLDPNAPPKPKNEAGPAFGPGGVGAPLVGPISPGGPGFGIRPSLSPAPRTLHP